MRSRAPARMDVIKKEDKEIRLKEFILRDLEARKASGEAAGHDYALVARSLDSPVARAFAAVQADLAHANIAVRILLLQTTPEDLAASSLPACGGAIRTITEQRLINAHEQLVLGVATAWIGDSMRREPAKRDAYECYAEGSNEVAGWAATSFERLWQKGAPFERTPMPVAPARLADVVPEMDPVTPAPIASEAAPESTADVSTRH